MNKSGIFCSLYSRSAKEQLFGTAKHVESWFLVEHRGRWEYDAVDSLPPGAKAKVETLKAQLPRMRFGLIRQSGRNHGPLKGFLALSRELEPRLYSFEIENPNELPSLDVNHLQPWDRRLFAVCTHGIHDRCCAKFGNALYQSMARHAGDDVWQISHIGGCRFAANVLCLPHGVVYGRVQEEDCAEIVASYRRGALACRFLRGRSCYPAPVQAAEYFLRTDRHLIDRHLDELCDIECTATAGAEETGWEVGFRVPRFQENYGVQLVLEDSATTTYKSCSAPEPSLRRRFRLDACVPGKT